MGFWLYASTASVAAYLVYQVVVVPLRQFRQLESQGVHGLGFKPILGHLPDLLKATEKSFETGQFNAFFDDLVAKFGPVFHISFGIRARLMVADPEMIKDILVTNNDCYEKPHEMKSAMSILMGNGLVLSEGKLHDTQRKSIGPAFHVKALRFMSRDMVDASHAGFARWAAAIETGGDVEMHESLSELALDIISNAAFGTKILASTSQGKSERASLIYSCLSILLPAVSDYVLTGKFLIPGFLSLPTPGNRELLTRSSQLKNLVREIVHKRREERNMTKKAFEEEEEDDCDKRTDLLEMLISARDDSDHGMSEEMMVDEAITFFLAGHETTSQLLSWTLYLLSQNKIWEQLLLEDVLSISPVGSDPSYDDVSKMKVLTMVLYETMRLLPPVPIIVRKCIRANTLAGKVCVPAGLNLTIPIATVHRTESLWPDPLTYNPERFRDGLSTALEHQMAFLPFSHGKRNCVGANFALLEAKIVLAMLIKKYSFELSASYRHAPEPAITLRPKFGLPMKLIPRSLSPQ